MENNVLQAISKPIYDREATLGSQADILGLAVL